LQIHKGRPLFVGVSAVELSDGTIEGRRCETFYSAKNLITIMAEGKIIAKERERVR
jgi:hypothetical protein